MNVEIQILKQQYKDKMKSDQHLKGLLAATNKVSTWTIDQWRLKNDPMLTTATNLKLVKDYLELDESEVLTEAVVDESTPEKIEESIPEEVEEHIS